MKNAVGCYGIPAGKVKEHMKGIIKRLVDCYIKAGTGHEAQVFRSVLVVLEDMSGLSECAAVGRTLRTYFTVKL